MGSISPMMISCDFSNEKSELVTRLAEGALGIREDLSGRDREHRERLFLGYDFSIACGREKTSPILLFSGDV